MGRDISLGDVLLARRPPLGFFFPNATLLRVMPTGRRPEQLYNLDTFAARDGGLEDLDTIEEVTPDAWDRVRALAGLGGSGERLKAIPLDSE